MSKDSVPFFSFKSSLEFEKKIYNLSITVFYNSKTCRKEYEVLSNEFNGATKLLVHNKVTDSPEKEWVDINTLDKSLIVQEIGDVIYRHNV
jgi:hypothetical protein